MSEPDLDNQTDFVVHPQVLCDRDGEKLTVIVKATFEIALDGKNRGRDGTFVPAPPERMRKMRQGDAPWGKPEIASYRYPSDLCIQKPGTDVIVVGRAFSPRGESVPTFEAGVRLGRLQKIVRVTGQRVWLPDGTLSKPLPVESVDLRYDLAFGGSDDSDPRQYVEEPRNPVGRGKARDISVVSGKKAPQIEDPAEPIEVFGKDYAPAGLGVVGRSYMPRRALWGTYDKRWLEERAPLLPADFDERANHAASAGLVASPPLAGGEAGALMNLVPGGGALPFTLPRVPLEITFVVKDRSPVTHRPHLDTVILDAWPRDAAPPLTIELVQRASVVAPRKLSDARILVREKKDGPRVAR